jgi:hypothetical protein
VGKIGVRSTNLASLTPAHLTTPVRITMLQHDRFKDLGSLFKSVWKKKIARMDGEFFQIQLVPKR